jgi:non-ribosomal peptide synthetase component F
MASMDVEDLCLHELFERQACRSPRETALVDERESLTYEELDRRADLLAAHLRDAGVGADDIVGVYMEHCAAQVVPEE